MYPHFSGIYVGAPNGDFFYVNRSEDHSPDGYRTKIIQHGGDRRHVRLRFRGSDRRVLVEQTDPQDAFDPRSRPWYQSASTQNAIVWTDPYIFYTSQKPGITIAGPVYRKGDRDHLQAIVGVDIEIDQLSSFIASLRIGKNGRAFMFNNNNDVVAFHDPEKLKYAQQDGNLRLVKIHEMADAIGKTAYEAVAWAHDDSGRIHLAAPVFARFVHDGMPYNAMFAPFRDPQWPWIVGVYLPESDYLGAIQENRQAGILMAIGISIIATLIGLVSVRGIVRPLSELEKEAVAIKEHDLSQDHVSGSIFKEIQETADSFSRMKQALRTSEEKYRHIFNNIQDVYYETTLDGQIVELSPSIEKSSRYTRQELVGIWMDDLYQEIAERTAFVDAIRADGKVTDYEIRLRDKDGTLLYCAITAALKYNAQGQPVGIVGSLRNINDRKNSEIKLLRYQTQLETLVRERTCELEQSNQQLRLAFETRKANEEVIRKSEEKYRSIIENMDNGYYELDLSGNIVFFNDPYCKIIGFSKEEMVGLNFRRYMAPETIDSLQRRFRAIYKTGIPEKLSRFNLIRKDGTHKTVEASVALITGHQGEPLGFRGVVLDISERLAAEHEKKKLEERLQQIQRLEGIGTLAGGVAHDFNNLLMGIQGNVSLMLLTTSPGGRHHDKLKSIESCVAAGADLTRQLLGFARGGKYQVQALNMNQVIHITTGMFGRTRKEIRIVEKLAEPLWTIMADQSQIEQVLLNLFINAWQAMAEGGIIFLETGNVQLSEEFVRPYGIAAGRYVRISVTDTGIGMDEVTQQRIFEPFFTTKEIGRGTGLGLASVYGIVKNHDGAIDVSSRLGEGTTFYIYLPASDCPVAKQDPLYTVAHGAGTILVVDDEDTVLEVSRNMLEKLGYEAIAVLGGHNAIATFAQTSRDIDMVLLDMIMPDLGGGAVLDRLKTIRPDVKVLLSSGYSLSEQAEAIVARGCAGFIQKPFSIEQLGKKINEVLNGTCPRPPCDPEGRHDHR